MSVNGDPPLKAAISQNRPSFYRDSPFQPWMQINWKWRLLCFAGNMWSAFVLYGIFWKRRRILNEKAVLRIRKVPFCWWHSFSSYQRKVQIVNVNWKRFCSVFQCRKCGSDIRMSSGVTRESRFCAHWANSLTKSGHPEFECRKRPRNFRSAKEGLNSLTNKKWKTRETWIQLL